MSNIGTKFKLEESKPTLLKKYASAFGSFYRKNFAYRIYWGRSSLYRSFIHFSIITLTVIVTLGGISTRLTANSNRSNTIVADSITSGNVDLLEQGGSVQSILLATTTSNFEIITYTVKEGDTYASISDNFGVTPESIKLSNANTVSYYDATPPVGKQLRIPELNGVLIDIKEGDTLDKIMNYITAGNRLDIIEINNLKEPDYALTPNSVILVPDGLFPPPPPPTPSIIYSAPPPPAPIPAPSEAVFQGVQFVDPLSNCPGYGYSRGFSSWHNGVDLPKRGGCPIRAAAAGTVEFAGWSSGGEGFMVRINHGNGVKSLYFHGDGQMWVTAGQQVYAGQDIMYMGCTGNCTGTHLHFSLKYNGIWINPAPYVPYARPY
ncbi:peptidoglycan DD-metalloendopeptidase family protein [Candidatus Dojkabacteria bacterium]|uniref:Peptidoglycan DD-metalloendopeptidase family protein n=1 Tax=Candidatus Dojkabacteria bacterium TaxID=2099670 RepID=A0A955L247_9BACT|nr:peptidoglycan DD-metalloendopeptidase family protein [Candidatus Dojkabacteria bacterium]